MPVGWKNHIASDPEVLRGKPRLKGTRIPVGLVLGYLAAGKTAEDIIAELPDLVVITKAQEIDAILVSLNGDFSHIVNYPPKNYKGIVALQMHNHAEILPELIARLTAYLKVNTTMDHYRGKLLVVEVDRIRIRE